MHKLTKTLSLADKFIRENASTLLTSVGVTGTVTTAYLASTASYHAALDILHMESTEGVSDDPREVLRARVKLVAPRYIPAAISGVLTIGCIIGAAKLSSRKAAALTAAYSLSDRAFHEYRDKVTELFGETKHKKVLEEVAKDHISASPPGETILLGSGSVLCCEMYTGRYFNCDMETLLRAQNTVNFKINSHGSACLADFYEEVRLPYTDNSWETGWQDHLLELEFSAVLTEDQRPCLAFSYKKITTL